MNSSHPQHIKLPRPIYEEIIQHSREGKPEEICGVLRGRGREAFELFRGRNVASERIDNYDVDPQTLLLQFKFDEAGDSMMGIYHSHPVSVAFPSATDAWNAHYPDSIYFICSLEFDDAPVIRAFRMETHFLDDISAEEAAAIRNGLKFFEIRPNSNVFAHFVAADTAVPAPVEKWASALQPPLYVEYVTNGVEISDLRIIEITEFELHIEDL